LLLAAYRVVREQPDGAVHLSCLQAQPPLPGEAHLMSYQYKTNVEQLHREEQFLVEYDNDESFRNGVRQAVHAIKDVLYHTDVTEEWLGHVVAMEGHCNCDIGSNYDGYEMSACEHYHANYRDWYLRYNQITEEELQAQERQQAEELQRKIAEEVERERQWELQRLRELAAKYNVDPRLLP
jgi:hypothetical protein